MGRPDPICRPQPDPATLSYREWIEAEAEAERRERRSFPAVSMVRALSSLPVATPHGAATAPTRPLPRERALEHAEVIAARAAAVVESWRRAADPAASQSLSLAVIDLSRTLERARGASDGEERAT